MPQAIETSPEFSSIKFWADALASCSSLVDLSATVNAAEGALSEQDRKNLDLTSLPTFGGAEPRNTEGIFSWDDNRLLIQDHNGMFMIVDRD